MSEPAPLPRFFQPVTLLAGVALGLLGLSWAGRSVIDRDWHRDFVRFHPLIAPETLYRPTVGEMRAIVRARCRPDQILVIVGGNSILQGVGQPVEKLWTKHLQELLGLRYCVVNLAFRGSSPTDGGALVAESLRDEFPRLIYLANVPPFVAAPPAGGRDYRFMLFDALHKGWLLDWPDRNAELADYFSRPDLYPGGRELDLGARLDAWLRFRDLWQWWSATHFFTFPTTLTPEAARAFRPRNDFEDREPDFETISVAHRFAPQFAAVEMQITRNTIAQFYRQDASGHWILDEGAVHQFRTLATAAFHDSLKARTLIVLSSNCPFYVRQLTPAERERDTLAFRDSAAEWRALGYAATDYGAGFTDDDFGDRTHLTAGGGRKLAHHLAPEIRALARQLAYPNP